MDWIHCNGCFVQPKASSNSMKFHLTSCGHIFCERCNEAETANKCRVCQAQYTTTVLSSQLREEVRDFFTDPEGLLNKVAKVIEYQKSHRERLMANFRRLPAKYESAKRELEKLHEQNRVLRKKLHVQQQEIAWYKTQRDRMRAARAAPPPPTPGSSITPSPFHADTQRASLQSMRNSGLGNSRISMVYTGGSTPSHASHARHSQEPLLSPLSMLPPATPFSTSQYRSQHYGTPESTPGGIPSSASYVAASPISSAGGSYRHSSSQQRRHLHSHSPPSRGTPTDALKILSLAFSNNKKQ